MLIICKWKKVNPSKQNINSRVVYVMTKGIQTVWGVYDFWTPERVPGSVIAHRVPFWSSKINIETSYTCTQRIPGKLQYDKSKLHKDIKGIVGEALW